VQAAKTSFQDALAISAQLSFVIVFLEVIMKTLDVDLEMMFQSFEQESEADINRIESESEIVKTRSLTPVLLKNASGCSSAIANGLSQQLIHQMNLISPGLMVSFDDLNVDLTQAAFPFLQPAAKEALRKAIADRGCSIGIASAYRTIAQQLFLYNRRGGRGGCSYTLVALPGRSNHQSGLALDVGDFSGWCSYLEKHGWRWLGRTVPNDKVHFDYVGPGKIDLRSIAVKAFQQLWNKNHPEDKIAEDGEWGNQTHDRLNQSPVEGFSLAPWDNKPRLLRLARPLMQGSDVRKLQQALIQHGESIQPDGMFGSGTLAALKRVQEKLGLKPDGIAGQETLAALNGEAVVATLPDPPTSPGPSAQPEAATPPASPAPEVNITLKKGDVSIEVLELQKLLAAQNCYSGTCDGDYGPNTKGAVEAFQRKAGLTADGVAGPKTLKALGYAFKAIQRTVDTGLFTVDLVAQIFHDAPRANIEKYLPPVLKALEKVGLGDRDMVLMALGTIRAETGSFVPISEYKSQYNTDPGCHLFNLYDFRDDLGNCAVGDGAKYKGRGFVQLTGKHNYGKFSAELGLGDRLLNEPDLANDPQIAADLLALFLKSKEGGIRLDLHREDYKTARWRVNGGSHGLDVFTAAFKNGEALLNGDLKATQPVLKLTNPYMQGEWVRKVQTALKANGIAVDVDGVFGPGTKVAVEKFQGKYGLVVDGVVGPNTLERLGL
jgi:peptidoglycan L-alanyl-D-glutamate endopeptidase CwlK